MELTLDEIKEVSCFECLVDPIPKGSEHIPVDKLVPNTWYRVSSRNDRLAYWCGKHFSTVCSGWPGENYFASLDSHWDLGGTIKPYSIIRMPNKFYE